MCSTEHLESLDFRDSLRVKEILTNVNFLKILHKYELLYIKMSSQSRIPAYCILSLIKKIYFISERVVILKTCKAFGFNLFMSHHNTFAVIKLLCIINKKIMNST